MRCTSCGTEVNGQNFCPACGNQVVRQQNPQFVPNQPQQAQPLPNYAQPQQGGNTNTVPNQYASAQTTNKLVNNGTQPLNYGQPQQIPPQQQNYQHPQQAYQQPNQFTYQQPQQPQQPVQSVQTPNAQGAGYGQPQQPQSTQYAYQQQPNFNQSQQTQNQNNGTDINETWKVALSYIPAGFWFGILDKSKTGSYASNQGLWALITIGVPGILVWVLNIILLSISYKLIFMTAILNGAYALLCLAVGIFCLIGLIKGFQGEVIEFPILGKKRLIK